MESRGRPSQGRPENRRQHSGRRSRRREAAVEQATARYQAGLGNIDEVAEAQRLLTQSEIDDALARLGVWRGLLGVAAAAGDITPFVAEASR